MNIRDRLLEASSTGLDLSPGDPLCKEALDEILKLDEQLGTALALLRTYKHFLELNMLTTGK